jgi:hypothetical protein
MKKHHLQSNLGLHLMSMKFRLQDWLRQPIRILQEAGVRSGTTLLGFGCGRVKLQAYKLRQMESGFPG